MANDKVTILVIEDEEPLRRFLRATLRSQDYRVIEGATGEEGLRMAAAERPDLILLDLGLPDVDGLAVTRRLREWTATPVIVVSARGREHEKVAALDAGADDYLTKPFGVGELLARIRVVRRHLARVDAESGASAYEVGALRVDLARHQVTVGGRDVHLTPNEFKLVAELAKNAGKVLTHRHLLAAVWGPGSEAEAHYLRVYMNQLRQKLEADPARPEYLLTEPGVGYRLAGE